MTLWPPSSTPSSRTPCTRASSGTLYPAAGAAAAEAGYTFAQPGRDGAPVRVFSCGYADDMVLVASSARACRRQHEWVRAFYGAHAFALNCDKTKYLRSGGGAPALYSVDGLSCVDSQPAGTTVRYLGAYINLELSWTVQRQRMTAAVARTCSAIRRHRMTLPMATFAVQQQLLPKLRLGIILARVPQSTLQKWDSQVRRAAFCASRISMGHNLKADAIHQATGLPLLVDQALAVRVNELLVTLNAEYPSSATCWARLNGRLTGAGLARSARCRAADTLCLLRRVPGFAVAATGVPTRRPAGRNSPWPPQPPDAPPGWAEAWRPASLAALRQGGLGESYRAYTDGSTDEHRDHPSGCSVVFATPTGGEDRSLGFAVATRGNNYLAEAVAVLYALVVTPASADLDIHTDSLSCVQAINSTRDREAGQWQDFCATFHTPQRHRILTAARPVLSSIRAMIRDRPGPTCLHWVRAHSGAADTHSVLNDAADRVANEARVAALADPSLASGGGFAGEEPVTLVLRGWTTTGAYSRSVLMERQEAALDRLATSGRGPGAGRQSRIARVARSGLARYFRSTRRSKDGALQAFAALAVPEWLPTEAGRVCSDALFRGMPEEHHNLGKGASCKLCGAKLETQEHALCDCPAAAPLKARQNSVWAALRTLDRPPPGFDPPATRYADARVVKGAALIAPAFFDPSGVAALRICPKTSPVLVDSLRSVNRMAGLMGILPPGLDKILGWEEISRGHWRRLSLAAVEDRLSDLQSALVRGCHRVWEARCGAMDLWFDSPASAAWRVDEDLAMEARHAKALNSKRLRRERDERKAASALVGPAPRPVAGPTAAALARAGHARPRGPPHRLRPEEGHLWGAAQAGALLAKDPDGPGSGRRRVPRLSWY